MQENIIENLEYIALFLGIILATIVLAYLVNRAFKRFIFKLKQSASTDTTTYQFLSRAASATVYLVGFGLAASTIPSLRTLAGSLLAGAGILAVAAGFASQHALSNIISGVFIIIFKPFKVNDRVKLREFSGAIEDITLRHTVIRDFENRRILVPNAVISNEIIINSDFNEDKICKWIDISISYGSDMDLAKTIMREEVMAHPLLIDNRNPEQIVAGQEKVVIRVIQLAESAVNLRAWAWAKDNADAFAMGCDLLESIKKRFDKEGIEIPFPHRMLVHKDTSNTSVNQHPI